MILYYQNGRYNTILILDIKKTYDFISHFPIFNDFQWWWFSMILITVVRNKKKYKIQKNNQRILNWLFLFCYDI